MTISDRLFETAIQDLNSVEVLYKSKHYNVALFQLQQSIEKIVKSFGIKANIIEPKDIVKKINHLPHKVFIHFYQNQITELSKYHEMPSLIPNMVPPHQRGKSKSEQNLKQLKKLSSEISNSEILKIKEIPVEEIEKFIEDAKKLEKEPSFDDDKLFAEIKDDFIKTNEHFIEYFKGDNNIKEISEEFIRKSDEIVKSKVMNYKLSRIQQRKFGYISYVWINLSLITSPHEQTTRYPSIENEDNPCNMYDENNTLIRHIPKLVEIMRKTIKKYKEVYV